MKPDSPLFEIYNGVIHPSGTPLFTSDNRVFRYGDGLFETICVRNRQPLFIEDHFSRLTKGLKILSIPLYADFTLPHLTTAVHDLLLKNELSHARLRLVAFREATGWYAPQESTCSWMLSVTGKVTPYYQTASTGFSADVFESDFKTVGALANLKTLNSLLYILAATEARQKGFDELLITNHKGNVIESISSNVFLRQGTVFKTPPLSEGCLEGVMRKQVIRLLQEKNLEIQEVPLKIEDIMASDEVILTNVIRGAGWIENFRGKKFQSSCASMINSWLNEKTGCNQNI